MREHIQLAYTDMTQPELVGRPEREAVISQDDILNLKISLEIISDSAELVLDRYLFN
ncbi:MAG: hypothetical protein OCC49_14880 [Fibrobacterales bacterium]